MKVVIEITVEVSEECVPGLIEWVEGFSPFYFEEALQGSVILTSVERVVSVKAIKEVSDESSD